MGNQTVVYTAYDEKTETLLNPVAVKVGSSDGETVEILEGLTSGQTYYYAYYDTLEISYGSARPDSGSESGKNDVETKTVDLANAHISVEIDGGKESGSMSNIKAGTFVTITINGKGEATYVLVSAQTSFGGGRNPRK